MTDNVVNFTHLFYENVYIFIEMAQASEHASYSITEVFHPKYRKSDSKRTTFNQGNNSTYKQSNQKSILPNITSTFDQINSCIGRLEDMFQTRMKVHEEELIQITHSELKKIMAQSKKVIEQYSQLIHQKNLSQELLDLKYQVVYYQKRACEFFKENNQLKSTIKKLKEEILSLQIGEQCDHKALQRLSKKYLKEKTLKNKLMFSHLRRPQSNLSLLANEKIQILSRPSPNPEKQEKSSIKIPRMFHDRQRSQPLSMLFKSGSEEKTRQPSFNPKKLKIKVSHLSTSP